MRGVSSPGRLSASTSSNRHAPERAAASITSEAASSNELAMNWPELRLWQVNVTALLFMMGFGALHEIMEYMS